MNETSQRMQVICNEKETVGSFQYEAYSDKDALLHGLKMTLMALLATGLTIAIPFIHFVTVPLGVLISPLVGVYFFFARRGKPKWVVGDFTCPECQADNHVETEELQPQYFGKCHQCGQDFSMVLVQADLPRKSPA